MNGKLPTRAENSLLERLEQTLVVAPRTSQVEFASAAACYRALSLHDEWSYARLVDYVTERLGISVGVWYDAVGAGELFIQSRPCREAYLQGKVCLTAMHLLARFCTVAEAESLLTAAASTTTSELARMLRKHGGPRVSSTATEGGDQKVDAVQSEQPNEVELRLRLPRSVVSYCEDTLELAHAIAGQSLPQSAALAIVLAEASTEIDRSRSRSPHVPACLMGHTRNQGNRSASSRRRPLTLPRPLDRRRLAIRLDAVLRRETARLTRLRARSEDLLLEALQTDLHGPLGYPTFPRFARARLGISRSRLYEMLRQARLRRLADPIARARATGRISVVQANLLAELPRIGVPRSCLHHWIRRASRTTVRMLRRLLAWARRTARTDVLGWARESYRPPSESCVRTTESPLEELARNPDPRLRVQVTTEPCETVHWHLDPGDHCMLLELVDSLQLSLVSRGSRRPPLWHSILRLFHLARLAWADLEASMPRHPHRGVLRRDRYTCQVPGCRQRAVEVHHLRYASRGGSDEPSNLVCLCPYHHRAGEHSGRMRIRGQVTPSRRRLVFELGVRDPELPLLRYRGERLVTPSGQPDGSRSLCPA